MEKGKALTLSAEEADWLFCFSKKGSSIQLKLVSGKPHSRKDELLTKGF